MREAYRGLNGRRRRPAHDAAGNGTIIVRPGWQRQSRAARALWPGEGPFADAVDDVLERDLVLAAMNPARDRYAGLRHRLAPGRRRAGATRRGPCPPPRACSRRWAAASSGCARPWGSGPRSRAPRWCGCVVAAPAATRVEEPAGDVGGVDRPVSSSSSLTRQQRPQPSQRLSHWAVVHVLEGVVRQNGSGRPRAPTVRTAGSVRGSRLAASADRQSWRFASLAVPPAGDRPVHRKYPGSRPVSRERDRPSIKHAPERGKSSRLA